MLTFTREPSPSFSVREADHISGRIGRGGGVGEPCAADSACADALVYLKMDAPDFAILDAVLTDGPCVVLARELQQRRVPFLIYSGADAFKELADEFREVQWIEKPCDIPTVINAALTLAARVR